jgi:hypothetical protein
MDVVVVIFRFLHLLGFAAVFGGLVMQLGRQQWDVNSAMLHGSLFQLVTGLVLLFTQLSDVDHMKVGVKLLLLLGLLVFFFLKRRSGLSKAGFVSSLAAVVVIVGIAVFWGGFAAGA